MVCFAHVRRNTSLQRSRGSNACKQGAQGPQAQRAQYPLIKECPLNHKGIQILMIYSKPHKVGNRMKAK